MITNWAGNVRFQPKRQHRPLSLEEMQRALAGAERVRAVGSAHSFNRVADTDGVLIDLSGMPRHVELDSERRLARVSGGWTYGDLCPELHAAGWALGNLASLPHIIVAGACATATHGSGRRNACLANEIEEVELIGGGRVPWCTEPRCLNALQERPTEPERVACPALLLEDAQGWSAIGSELPEAADGVGSASVAVDFDLEPGRERVVRFCLAWHAPCWEGSPAPSRSGTTSSGTDRSGTG